MDWYKETLSITTQGKGLYPFSDIINARLKSWSVVEGMCFLYIPHCSASLVINENYDPTAQRDMEELFEQLIPEGQAWYTHTLEGSDDSPAHLRAMITPVSLSIPIDDGRLSLGTWQGIYLAEHRRRMQTRQVFMRVLAML